MTLKIDKELAVKEELDFIEFHNIFKQAKKHRMEKTSVLSLDRKLQDEDFLVKGDVTTSEDEEEK